MAMAWGRPNSSPARLLPPEDKWECFACRNDNTMLISKKVVKRMAPWKMMLARRSFLGPFVFLSESKLAEKNFEFWSKQKLVSYVPGLNPHYFHIIGDGHQPNSRGFYIPIIRIPIKGGMTIPNIGSLDHGTYARLAAWTTHESLF